MDHFFLEGRDLSELPAGGHDELEFVGRVHRTLSDPARTQRSQYPSRGPAHHEQQRTGQGQKDVHRTGHRQRHLLRPLQGQRLGNQFAQNDVQAGDQNEGDEDCDAVCVNRGVGNILNRAQHHLGQQGLADPAQGQADDGDSQLDAVDHFVQVAMELLHDAGANATGRNQLLDAGITDADQREFRGREECVGRHQEQDEEHPQQHVGNHGRLILTFQRDMA